MMQRIISFSNRMVEAGCLMAIIAIPLFFNPYSSRVFEADKTYILITIFCLIAILSVIRRLGDEPYKIPNQGFVWLACSFAAVYWVSSMLSISPSISFGGYYLREEGWLALCAYVGIFLLLVYNLRSAFQIDRIITAAILIGFVVALYGIFQKFGKDIVPWASDVATRVTTTFGNPIFAGAFLIMVIPLTLYRLIETISGRPLRVAPTILYALILVVQVWCVIATQSRGPFIGLIAGIFFFLLLYTIHRGHKRLLLATVAVVVLIGVFVLLLNIEKSPLSGLKPRMGRLGEMTQAETGSGKVRLLIWEGAVSILSAEPTRLFFGYGLEAMFPLYHRHTPGQFARYEGSFAVPDHSHNDTFDCLITGGIISLAIYLGIIALIIYLSLRRLEIIKQSPIRFFGICTAGVLLGILVPYIITGKMIFLGLGIPFGLLFAIICYLLMIGFKSSTTPISGLPDPSSLLIIALLAGIVGHFVEIQFGIGVTSTRLYFWVYLALLAVLTATPVIKSAEKSEATAPREYSGQGGLFRNYSLYGIISGLILSVFIFELIKRKHLLEVIPNNFYIITGTIWVSIGLFAVLIYPPKQQGRETGIGAYFNYYLLILAVSGLVAGIFYLIYTNLISEASTLESLINLVYVWLGIVLVLLTFLLPTAEIRTGKPRLYLAPVFILFIPLFCFIVYTACLKNVYADMYCRHGDNLEKANRLPEAIASYRKSAELAPKVDYYYSSSALARAYQKSGNYEDALNALQKARQINPLNPFHISAIARLYSDWAESFKDKPEERANRLKESLRHYDELVVMTPNNPQVYREQGDVYFQMSDFKTAVAKYNEALQKDDRVGLTWFMLGRAYHQLNDVQKMIEAYETAYKLQMKQARFDLGRFGEEYFNNGRYEDSIAVNLALNRLEPQEYRHCQNLSLIYDKIGRPDEAAKYRQKAQELAPPDRNR